MRSEVLGVLHSLRRFASDTAGSGLVSSLAVAAIFTATIPATAAVIRVEADGSGDYPTIQAAFNVASEGDVVELGDGSFTGPGNTALSMPVPLTLRSGSGDPGACVIDGQSLGGGSLEAESFTLEGISFASMWVMAQDGVVQDCVFGDFSSLQITSFGAPPLIESCRFEGSDVGFLSKLVVAGSPHVVDCWFEGNSGDLGGSIYLEDRNGDALFEGCTFVDNTANLGGVIAVLERSNRPVFRNCTFYENSAANGGAIAYLGGLSPQTITFENCILMNSTGSEIVECAASTSVTMTCSISYGNELGDFPGCMSGLEIGFDNASVDPLFCDAENGDFRLQVGSPAAPSENCDLIGSHEVGCAAPSSAPELISSAVIEVSALPNPGRTFTHLRIQAPDVAELPSVIVTDVLGRKIRSLDAVRTGDGSFESLWDGRADDGAPVRAGVYFARVTLGGEEVHARIVRLR